jgi:Bacterial PH domain
MAAMRFESKRDAWIVLLLRVMPLVVLAIVTLAWYQTHHEMRGPILGALLLIIFEVFFFESVMRSTYYLIDGNTLIIRSSFITWRVPIAAIRSITPTRSALSSPALSLDRLRIDYGGKWILVSPEDKRRFIESLRAINPAIVA